MKELRKKIQVLNLIVIELQCISIALHLFPISINRKVFLSRMIHILESQINNQHHNNNYIRVFFHSECPSNLMNNKQLVKHNLYLIQLQVAFNHAHQFTVNDEHGHIFNNIANYSVQIHDFNRYFTLKKYKSNKRFFLRPKIQLQYERSLDPVTRIYNFFNHIRLFHKHERPHYTGLYLCTTVLWRICMYYTNSLYLYFILHITFSR